MAETYSVGWLGAGAGSAFQVKNMTAGDSVARPGAQINAMQDGAQFLVLMPDGSQAWHTYDAERSTPALPIYRRV
jgi:hypothetical protein